MIVVTDAGPLIYLAGAGRLDLLRSLFTRVVVPHVVYEEVVVAASGRVGAHEVAAAAWLEVVDAAPDRVLLLEIEPGEAAAIPLAQRIGAVLRASDERRPEQSSSRGPRVYDRGGRIGAGRRSGRTRGVGSALPELGSDRRRPRDHLAETLRLPSTFPRWTRKR